MNEENTTAGDEVFTDIGGIAPGAAAAAAGQSEEDLPFARLEAELDKLKSEVLYAQAETQNVRRRLEREKADATAYASTGFARDMLSVADNLARALAAIPDDMKSDEKMKPLVTGLEATGRELDTVFQRHGIKKIEAMGEKLDPNRHQAMLEIDHADVAPGTIVQEMQGGYMIRDRLLRPALVAVAKAG